MLIIFCLIFVVHSIFVGLQSWALRPGHFLNPMVKAVHNFQVLSNYHQRNHSLEKAEAKTIAEINTISEVIIL